MMRSSVALFISVVLVSLGVGTASAQHTLSEEALFRRCYAHITQLRPRLDNPLLAQVKSGGKSAVQACKEVLDSAKLTADGGTKIQNDSDTVAKAVLRTFHELHRSWAMYQVLFNSGGGGGTTGTATWFEDSPMGSYVTRALFSSSHNVDSVTQGTDFLQPVRTTMNPPPSYGGVPAEFVVFRLTSPEPGIVLPPGVSHPFAPRGELLGIRTVNIPPVKFFPVKSISELTLLPDFANIGVDPVATATLTSLNLTDVDAVNGPLTETTQFAARITGSLNVPTSGDYTIYLDANDIASLFINGTRQIDVTSMYSGEKSKLITLNAGLHSLLIEYRQKLDLAKLIVKWKGPEIAKQPIPNSALVGLQAQYYLQYQAPALQPTGNSGGGFLGNQNYFITSYTEIGTDYVPNGALATNRSWPKAVLSDALCREIPVVREADVTQFVVPDSPTAFRQAAACTTCHASVDRQAGIIRGLRYNILGFTYSPPPGLSRHGIRGLTLLNPSLPELNSWSDLPVSDYAKRAPYGHFYFRNLHGDLVDQEIRTIEELGTAIRSQDDYYACFAKRYYHYFTGIDVKLGDPGDVSYPAKNAVDTLHYDKILWLADRLKNTKSLSQLILDIIGSDEYRRSDYGIAQMEQQS